MTSASPYSPEPDAEPAARLTLPQFLQRFGRDISRDPVRCSGLLRDLCQGSYREHFLWTAALREGVVAELRAGMAELPRELLVTNLARKLSERLGLATSAAEWAVRGWAEALDAAPERTAETDPPELPALAGAGRAARAATVRWLLGCAGALVSSGVVLAAVACCCLRLQIDSVGHWVAASSVLVGGCLAGWAGLHWSARWLVARPRPDWSHLSATRATAALLPEILVVLVLPMVPLVAVAVWAGVFWAEWPATTGVVFLAWLLARLFAGLLVAGVTAAWLPPAIALTGRLASGWRGLS